jgi:hypothetical protein
MNLQKDFSTNIILTSQNSEAFLSFRYIDGSTAYIVPFVNSSIGNEILFINGLDINYMYPDPCLNSCLELNSVNNIASFHLFTFQPNDFDFILSFKIYDSSDLSTSEQIDVSIFNRPFIIRNNVINIFNTSTIQEDNIASYLLMRSNPKLSGNIKLVINSDNKIYLDTFPVTNALSNKVFRKVEISPGNDNENTSGDRYEIKVSKVYGQGGINNNLPKDDLFKINDQENFDITSPKRKYDEQYELTYSYGARLLKEELYSDSYAILAPLWINKKLPDYFVIFRLSGAYNTETYINGEILFQRFLTDSSIVKSWSLKKNVTPIGILLNRYIEEINKKQGSVFLSLDKDITSNQVPNSWIGIDVDSGVIAPKNVYTNELIHNENNYTQLNNYISTKFSGLNSLCPNLLNLEFTFSDNEVSDYSMNRYFGLYLSENELYKIFYYQENTTDASVTIKSLDDKVINNFFESSIFYNKDINANYKNRIFALIDNDGKVNRFSNLDYINGEASINLSNYINKPNKNIFSVNAELVSIKKFITFTLENHLHQGEHLRVINTTQNKLWELYGLDSSLLEKGTSWCYNSEYTIEQYPNLVRTAFSVAGTKEDQTDAIISGFNSFKDFELCPFTVYKNSNDTISLVLNSYANSTDNYIFQRLTSQTRDIFYDASSSFNNAANYSDISFFSVYNPSDNDFEIISFDASYGPINFELYGDRKSLLINFIEIGLNYTYSIDGSCYLNKDLKETRSLFQDYILYQAQHSWFKLIKEFDISTNINKESFNYVLDPTKSNKNLLIKTGAPIKLVNNKQWNAYSVLPVSISLMSINPVKDFDFTVYDKNLGYQSQYFYKRNNDNDTYEITLDASESIIIYDRYSLSITSGTGHISLGIKSVTYNVTDGNFLFNTFDSSIKISATSKTTIKYNILNGEHDFKSYKSYISEEDISTYYLDTFKTKLKYNLTVPYIVKWAAQGTDCRNNELRLLLNKDWMDRSNTNFIPTVDQFNSEISYPVFKYLSQGEREWKDYIYYDINDSVPYVEDNITKYIKLKDLIFKQPYNDIFSKITLNNNTEKTTSRSSLVYYDKISDSIKTIFLGLNLSISTFNFTKNYFNISNYDNYRFSFISTPSKNLTTNHPVELIINENTKTILMIWYQGNDILHYNKRYSDKSSGKSVLYGRGMDPFFLTGFLTSNVDSSEGYSYIKTPFNTNTANYIPGITNIFGIENNYSTLESSKLSQFSFSYNSSLGYIFTPFGENRVEDNVFIFNKSYNTFLNRVSYLPLKNIDSYGNRVINLSYQFNSNNNLYKNNTCNYTTLEKLLSNGNNVMFYIIRETTILSNYNFNSSPLFISLLSPQFYNDIYTYNGYYTPKFNNILEFNSNEDNDIIEVTEKDFVHANTNLKSYNYIPQLWYNKVSLISSSEGNSIRFKDFNPFSSQWDNYYYYLEDNSIGLIPGYYASTERPSFFGSKLIKLPHELTFDFYNWNVNSITTITKSLNEPKIQLSINLTNVILNNFKNNNDFVNNWSYLSTNNNPLGISSNFIIENYIKDTVISYYDYDLNDIDIKFYIKSKIINNADYVLVNGTNFERELKLVNNNLVYFIRFSYSNYSDFDYYIQIKIKEK